MSWPQEEAGCPGAGRGQLVPDLFKGQRFSTLLIGGGGCRVGPLLLNTHHLGRGWWGSEIWRPCPCSPARGVGGGAPKGPLFPWKRGAASLLQTALLEQPHCWLPHRPKLGEPFFCQHSVNTQYCIKAINRHFKETETQFSHQSQEQRLGGLRNVTTQLAAPPPPTPPCPAPG